MALTTKIMVIRHAEKPTDKGGPIGIDFDGNPDENSLIVRGWQRAGALAHFFAPAPGQFSHSALATPNVLFASNSKSHRPFQTIKPLAKKLKIDPNRAFQKEELDPLVDAVLSCGGTALVSWQHEKIPAIAQLILGNNGHVAPQKWPDDRFDLVWVFDLQNSGRYDFQQVPQLLLNGDVDSPIMNH